MKTVLVLLSLILMLLPGQAQLKGFSVGPFAEKGMPTGSFKETNKNGYGAGFGADVRLGKIGFTGSVAYMHFGGKTINKAGENINMPAIKAVPLRVGLKYRIVPALYAKLESGIARFSGGDESAIIFSPGIGIRILGLDVQAKYEIWKREQSYSFWGLKAGINF
ncbi:MAG: outer membrane beta-barrel protein [Chitinophagaceae bacterium]